MTTSALINVMSAAVLKAGKGLLRDFNEVDQLQISRKGTANFVTAADIRTEKLLQKELSKARPEFGFLLEEGGEVPGKDETHRWIIDPLDGTSNFIHAIPYFCVSVGLEKRYGPNRSEIIAGVIYDPIHNELFTAEKGKGAFVNGRRLAVSRRDTLEDSLIVTGNPRTTCKEDIGGYKMMSGVIEKGAILRYFGATALDMAYLAAGRYDACCYFTCQPWDAAAGMLLIKEAGGSITTHQGKHADIYTHSLICSNSHLHLPIQKLFKQAA